MSKSNVVVIEHIEVRKKDIERAKKFFRVTDNAEAMKKALDVTTGKIELESIFDQFTGTKIKKVYA